MTYYVLINKFGAKIAKTPLLKTAKMWVANTGGKYVAVTE